MATKIEKDAYGCKNGTVSDWARTLCGITVCASVYVFLTRFLTFSDNAPFVCTLSWVAACNLPTYCLLPHCQKVQFMSNQARTLQLCWTLPAARVRQLRWRRTGGVCNGLQDCYTVLQRSGPVNESNTYWKWCCTLWAKSIGQSSCCR